MRLSLNLSGGEALVRTLKSNGVEHVFAGGGFTAIPDVLIDHPEIAYHLSLHENAAASMADGYAKSTGKPGVLFVHVAVGLSNAIGVIFGAKRDKTPLVVIAGERDTLMLGHQSYNEAQSMTDMVSQFVKYSWMIKRADKISEDITRGFKIALSPPMGPVFFSIPMDYLSQSSETPILDAQKYRVWPSYRPSSEAVSKAAHEVLQSTNPVILLGRGVGQSRASNEIIKLAELIGAPIFVEMNSYLIDLPTSNDLFIGEPDKDHPLIANADAVISIGGRTEIEMHHTGMTLFKAGTKFIEVNTDPEEIALLHPTQLGILADPREGTGDLIDQIERQLKPEHRSQIKDRISNVSRYKTNFEKELKRRASERWDNEPVSLGRFIVELSPFLKPETTALIGHGSGIALVRQLLKPWTVFMQNGAGLQGWILGAALGIKLGMPKKQVVAFLGDGNLMFGPQGLWTAAKYNIPVKFVVLDNGFYLTELTKKNLRTGNLLGADIGVPSTDYVQLSQSMHVPAASIERPGDIKPVLEKAFSHDDEPFLIDLHIDRTNSNQIVHDSIVNS